MNIKNQLFVFSTNGAHFGHLREAAARMDPLGFQLLCCVQIQCLGARILCFGYLTLLSPF